jgi:hypothetical protein
MEHKSGHDVVYQCNLDIQPIYNIDSFGQC